MPIALLFPRFDHPAIEERYASWQSQMLLRGGDGMGELRFYDPDEPASYAAAEVDSDLVLVVTDPLLLPSKRVGARLKELLESSGAAAALPTTNESAHAEQRRMPPAMYLTLRELQTVLGELEQQPASVAKTKWDASDPSIFLCRTELLESSDEPLRRVLAGKEVAISSTDYVHRWSSLRGQTRFDLLERIGTDAKSILEFGCGEAPLGEAIKKRQQARVVGIELDPVAAAIAQKRIDAVYRGDVREIVSILDEKFDWIIGGDIVEHLDEPWSFLSDLRRVANRGGKLLLSLPNIANAAIVNDLLHGRFDYVYMGLTCVGHLRFFTKRTIEEMLTLSGWSVVEIAPQDFGPTPAREELIQRLNAGGVEFSKDDLLPSGYYVIAQNDGP